MRLKFAVAMLLSAMVVFASPAGATRTESGYGQAGTGTGVSGVGEEWFATITDCGTSSSCTVNSSKDLLLYINPSLSGPIDVTLDLATTFNLGSILNPSTTDSPFGLINCVGAQQSNIGFDQGTLGPCDFGVNNTANTSNPTNGTTPSGCVLPNPTPGSPITIAIPSSCLQAGEVFYFDLADEQNISITPGTVAAPEPSSLALLGAALIPVAFLTRRRRQET
jgi:hypothetical protein